MKRLIVFAVLCASCSEGVEEPKPQTRYACSFNQSQQVNFSELEHPGAIRPKATQPNPSQMLVYRYITYCTSFLGCDSLKQEVRRAMDAWQRIPGLVFVAVEDPLQADIHISFESSTHEGPKTTRCKRDPGYPSRANTLAHALVEGCKAGHIHLNEDLGWSLSGTSADSQGRIQMDVRTVIIHEVGHLIGLNHNEKEESVMFPEYTGSKRNIVGDERLQQQVCQALELRC